jgi:hypothetical protein
MAELAEPHLFREEEAILSILKDSAATADACDRVIAVVRPLCEAAAAGEALHGAILQEIGRLIGTCAQTPEGALLNRLTGVVIDYESLNTKVLFDEGETVSPGLGETALARRLYRIRKTGII